MKHLIQLIVYGFIVAPAQASYIKKQKIFKVFVPTYKIVMSVKSKKIDGIISTATYLGTRAFYSSEQIASSSFLQWLPFFSGLVTCIAGYVIIVRAMPTRDIGGKVHFHGPYNVVVKDYDLSSTVNHPSFVDKDGKKRLCPGAAIYYPTTTKINDNDTTKWPSWCPFDDEEYAYGFSFYTSLPRYMFGHFKTSKIRAVNANDPEQEKNIELPENFQRDLGSKKFPVVIFAHGLAGHSRAYTTYACELASRGAVVIAPTFSDGSAIYSRTHAEKGLWPGPAHSTLESNGTEVMPERKDITPPSSPAKSKNGISEESFEVIYVMPPPEGDEEKTKARNDFRMKQIKHRVMETEEWREALESNFNLNNNKEKSTTPTTTAMKWIFENTKSSFSAAAFEQLSKDFQNQEKMIHYQGHSFGAGSSFIAAVERNLKNDKSSSSSTKKKQLPPMVLLDIWWLLPRLRFGLNSGVFKGETPTSQTAGYFSEDSKNGKEFVDPTNLPDICIIDSQLWQSVGHESRPFNQFLKDEWPQKFTEFGVGKTDHVAVSDLGIFSPIVSRNSNIVKYDEFTADEVPAIEAKLAWKIISGEN